jgi:hypothetical protein
MTRKKADPPKKGCRSEDAYDLAGWFGHNAKWAPPAAEKQAAKVARLLAEAAKMMEQLEADGVDLFFNPVGSVRATKRRIELVKITAAKTFGLCLADDHARQIIEWDVDRSFVAELDRDGHLDTAPRDYFGMALVELVMPGAPTVQDDLISDRQTRWHTPCNSSSDEYKKAFLRAFRAGVKRLGIGGKPSPGSRR